MTKITILRTNEPMPASLDSARVLLFGALDGFGEASKKAWRKLWRRIINLEPGEIVNVEAAIPRNPKFHRRFFALLNIGFDAWEPPRKHKTHKGRIVQKNFDQFREDILILAGFYEQTFDLLGRMKIRAKSISFANMDEAEFEAVYSAVVDVLLREALRTYSGREQVDEVVDRIMGFL